MARHERQSNEEGLSPDEQELLLAQEAFTKSVGRIAGAADEELERLRQLEENNPDAT
jgi:hypothetical protein